MIIATTKLKPNRKVLEGIDRAVRDLQEARTAYSECCPHPAELTTASPEIKKTLRRLGAAMTTCAETSARILGV
jgi:hypothetical protein